MHGCPAVMECELQQEVSLGDAPNTLMIGRVVVLHLDPSLEAVAGTSAIDPEALRPVGRLWGASYATLGTVISVPRPE